MSARVDLVTDPQIRSDLLVARRGQAHFSRQVRNLRDADFAAPSRVQGWSRGEVVAYVALSARALTRFTESARSGTTDSLWETRAARDALVAFTATLAPEAIRYLSDHAAVHLTVEWRDLTDAQWARSVPDGLGSGGSVVLAETPRLRARQVWLGGVALGAGAELRDIPADAADIIRDGRASTLGVPRTPDEWF